MTVERRVHADGRVTTHWISCPYCESAIGPQESFRRHYATCPGNPNAGGGR